MIFYGSIDNPEHWILNDADNESYVQCVHPRATILENCTGVTVGKGTYEDYTRARSEVRNEIPIEGTERSYWNILRWIDRKKWEDEHKSLSSPSVEFSKYTDLLNTGKLQELTLAYTEMTDAGSTYTRYGQNQYELSALETYKDKARNYYTTYNDVVPYIEEYYDITGMYKDVLDIHVPDYPVLVVDFENKTDEWVYNPPKAFLPPDMWFNLMMWNVEPPSDHVDKLGFGSPNQSRS